MYLHRYHLVDSRARSQIDLQNHQAEILRAFRYVSFLAGRITVLADRFEFCTSLPLTPADARSMGRQIARSATTLASQAVKVYVSHSGTAPKSTQLFKRRP
ncbi:hypothetical protein GGD40_001944 [Paraburkholderia bryophila]|uniref:Uncharacterized protein n=1 Tax=Paraburkholderia bryophila TaxID=420952 RepID=A0A7Y9WK90_9BURK|nr:hypothetical protein [Paraburkholderia bryophila]